MEETIQIKDKVFRTFLREKQILEGIKSVAENIEKTLKKDEIPIFLSVLNGSFIFAAELMKAFNLPAEITFVKVSSYVGTQSSGKVQSLIGMDVNLKGRRVIVLEDIVDTGTTLDFLYKSLEAHQPGSVEIATLLFKPSAYRGSHKIDYVGIEVPNEFLIGYGLDFDGLGRNLKDIYILDSK